jgi:hypothetical protein
MFMIWTSHKTLWDSEMKDDSVSLRWYRMRGTVGKCLH